MESCLTHILDRGSDKFLKAMLLELKGLISRDVEREYDTAREYLNNALDIYSQVKDDTKRARILIHLGKIDELDRKIDIATNLYQQALTIAINHNDSKSILDCYGNLARMNFLLGKYNEALINYKNQFDLADKALLASYRYQALKGLAQAANKLKRFEEAYRYGRLALEEKDAQYELNLLRDLLIAIADKALEVRLA